MPSEADEVRAFAEAAYGALNDGDLDAFLAFVDEQVEFTSMVAEAEGSTFRGHAGVRTWWETVYGEFDEPRWEVLAVLGTLERGVAQFRLTGALAGVPVDHIMWQAVRVRDGRLVWWGFARTEAEALRSLTG